MLQIMLKNAVDSEEDIILYESCKKIIVMKDLKSSVCLAYKKKTPKNTESSSKWLLYKHIHKEKISVIKRDL